jgi:hypothetical protein
MRRIKKTKLATKLASKHRDMDDDKEDKEDKEDEEGFEERLALKAENTRLRDKMEIREKMAFDNAFYTTAIMCCIFVLGWVVGHVNRRGLHTSCV